MITLSNNDIATVLQMICIALIFVEYLSQLIKIIRTKQAEDISKMFWAVKITIAILQVIVLIVLHSGINAYISQVLGIILSVMVFSSVLYYTRKNKGE